MRLNKITKGILFAVMMCGLVWMQEAAGKPAKRKKTTATLAQSKAKPSNGVKKGRKKKTKLPPPPVVPSGVSQDSTSPGVVSATQPTAPSVVTPKEGVPSSAGSAQPGTPGGMVAPVAPLPATAAPAIAQPAGSVVAPTAPLSAPVMVAPLEGSSSPAPVAVNPVVESTRGVQRLSLGFFGVMGGNVSYAGDQLYGEGGVSLMYDFYDGCGMKAKAGCIKGELILPRVSGGRYHASGQGFGTISAGLGLSVGLHERVAWYLHGGIGGMFSGVGTFAEQQDAGVPVFAKRNPADANYLMGWVHTGVMFAVKQRTSRMGPVNVVAGVIVQNAPRPYPGQSDVVSNGYPLNPTDFPTLNIAGTLALQLSF